MQYERVPFVCTWRRRKYSGAAQNEEAFLKQLGSIMQGVRSCNFQGYCYTQLCDVQQEVNGLLTAERKPKVDIQKLKALFGK